ncbi:hypothetical protein [Tautonia plasticadhaerens]|uniref:Uncharacterized protein n=1 Tax=Tautonia plasticadhaerens TaxID=2527974 RepID=A0A518HBV6_9BACT|nr:hypothetical protein [Tautonia plasticadhaerens]QDV38344.1 hypothetical protein ElP_62960 [Tautonia plasticadhaerens]
MLVLKRKEGQWIEIIHRSGDVIRLRVYDIQAVAGSASRANLAFDDSARNFEIRRPERRVTTPRPAAAGDLAPPAPIVAEAVVEVEPESGAVPALLVPQPD